MIDSDSASSALVPNNGYPGAPLGTSRDGFAEQHSLVTSLESGEAARLFELAGVQVVVEIAE
jgi:hypothetical protein